MENESILRGTNSDQDEEAGECFLRDILQDTTNLSFESEAILAPTTVADGGATTGDLSNYNSVVNYQQCASETTHPTACVLSFDKTLVTPDKPDPSYNHSHQSNYISSYSLKPKRTINEIPNDEPTVNRGTKKARSGAEATNHIMAERRRRQELTDRFIALSATIPGLKKIDKASILREALSYVKQLQERVKELEQETSKIIMEKPHEVSAGRNNIGGDKPASGEVNSDDCDRPNDNDALPEVKARISDNKQVLIRILCKKQKCTMFKILDELKNLHLSVFGNSVVPFGSSALDVTIIAQMTEEYSVSVKDIVKSMRMTLKCNGDPC